MTSDVTARTAGTSFMNWAYFRLQFNLNVICIISAVAGAVSCSHGRAHQYFIESIDSPCPFTAYPCTSAAEFHVGHCLQCHDSGCSQMGYNADKFTARGSLFLETEGSSAYCGEL